MWAKLKMVSRLVRELSPRFSHRRGYHFLLLSVRHYVVNERAFRGHSVFERRSVNARLFMNIDLLLTLYINWKPGVRIRAFDRM